MPSDFKKLNLDRSLLRESIQKYWDSNGCQQCDYIERKPNSHRVKYVQDDREVMVELLFIKDGTTTINTKVGKNQDVGELIATYLKSELVSDARKSVNLTVKNVSGQIFEDLLTFLEEFCNEESVTAAIVLESKTENAVQRSVKVSTEYKDSLTLTHYLTTHNLLIQGKPLYAYAQVSYFLSEYTDLDGFLSIVHKGESKPDIAVDQATVETELERLMPSAYDKVGQGILSLVSTSYALRGISLDLADYSCFVYPVLRAVEGVMRRLLLAEGCPVKNFKYAFGEIFYRDRHTSGRYVVREEYKNKFNNDSFCAALELCYNHYHQQRHALFHMDDLTDASMFIPTQDRAVHYIDTAIGIIEQAYSKIS